MISIRCTERCRRCISATVILPALSGLIAPTGKRALLPTLRKGHEEGDIAVVVCNFTPVVQEAYKIGVPQGGLFKERLNTDSEIYGGSNVGNAGAIMAVDTPHHGRPFSMELTLPPLGTVVLIPDRGAP